MKVIPEQTTPATDRIIRRHVPPPSTYTRYRGCLRWEFGFSCAFCLLHEADLAETGVEGKGLTSVEHAIRQMENTDLRNDYTNCFYACRYCNRDRGIALEARDGAELLNPCSAAWGAHFRRSGPDLVPSADDRDADYTERTYRLNSPVKTTAREKRAEAISDAVMVLHETPGLIAWLLEKSTGREDRDTSLAVAHMLMKDRRRAITQLERYMATPLDADAPCVCGASSQGLPLFFDTQCFEVVV